MLPSGQTHDSQAVRAGTVSEQSGARMEADETGRARRASLGVLEKGRRDSIGPLTTSWNPIDEP